MAGYNKGEGNYNKGNKNNSKLILITSLTILAVLLGIIFYRPIVNLANDWSNSISSFFDKKADEPNFVMQEDVEPILETLHPESIEDEIIIEEASDPLGDIEDNIEIAIADGNQETKDDLPVVEKSQGKPQPDKKHNEERYLKSFAGNNGKYGFIDITTGDVIIESQYDYYVRPGERKKTSYIAVKKNNKYGVIDLNNQIVIPFIYDNIEWVYNMEYWLVSRYDENRKYKKGLINSSNAKLCIPVEYEDLAIMGPAYFIMAKKNSLYGCIDNNNKVTIPIIYSSYSTIRSGTESRNIICFYDKDGNKFCYNKDGLAID